MAKRTWLAKAELGCRQQEEPIEMAMKEEAPPPLLAFDRFRFTSHGGDRERTARPLARPKALYMIGACSGLALAGPYVRTYYHECICMHAKGTAGRALACPWHGPGESARVVAVQAMERAGKARAQWHGMAAHVACPAGRERKRERDQRARWIGVVALGWLESRGSALEFGVDHQ